MIQNKLQQVCRERDARVRIHERVKDENENENENENERERERERERDTRNHNVRISRNLLSELLQRQSAVGILSQTGYHGTVDVLGIL
ncbi:hypothetical protein PHLCEN_2v3004 [Hermanssonia centrifuga]|uniref:Uncharacterized protein n=1 Tax=Hermanssonia centrifuga TaxID=98765 RepID=A0A2R6R7D4_9APHY|nr:hypothetical protein PHLCEN_2v3004 [Hermanssonia centrifuga]